MVPFFDDIFFDVLRSYVDREKHLMTAKMGSQWVSALDEQIDSAEALTAKWHASEFRFWHKAMAFVTGWFGIRTLVNKTRAITAGGTEKAMAWVNKGVSRWESEDRLSDQEVARLRSQMDEPEFQQVLPYLGGHILLSIPLRFPFGMIVRPLLVLGALGWSTIHLLRRKISKEQWRKAFGIHSPLVMFFAAMPAIGSLAYLASNPIRSNRLMLRVMADAALFKLPKDLYLKSGTRKWIAKAPVAVAFIAEENESQDAMKEAENQPAPMISNELDALAA
jgi:hypothetical protein